MTENATHETVMTAPTTALAVQESDERMVSPFAGPRNFASAQRMAQCLARCTFVPQEYRGPNGVANCVVALELASRLNASIFSIMQNVYVIHGRPSFSAQFIIALLHSCGRFGPLHYEFQGQNACRAWAIEKDTGERIDGPWVTMKMAEEEGWLNKNGSKWKTMPEMMLRYRSASFFGRLYAPDVMMGMYDADEVSDSAPASAPMAEVMAHDSVVTSQTAANTVENLNSMVDNPKQKDVGKVIDAEVDTPETPETPEPTSLRKDLKPEPTPTQAPEKPKKKAAEKPPAEPVPDEVSVFEDFEPLDEGEPF